MTLQLRFHLFRITTAGDEADATWRTISVSLQETSDILVAPRPEPLAADVTVAGSVAYRRCSYQPVRRTADWIVKLIDVYPDSPADDPAVTGSSAGFEQLVRGDVMRENQEQLRSSRTVCARLEVESESRNGRHPAHVQERATASWSNFKPAGSHWWTTNHADIRRHLPCGTPSRFQKADGASVHYSRSQPAISRTPSSSVRNIGRGMHVLLRRLFHPDPANPMHLRIRSFSTRDRLRRSRNRFVVFVRRNA